MLMVRSDESRRRSPCFLIHHIWHLRRVAAVVPFQHIDDGLHRPPSGLFNIELSALLQMSQQPSCELHIRDKLAANASESSLSCMNPHFTFHGMENTSFA